jgi:hypothetical protein
VSLDAVLGVLQQRGPAFRTDDTAMIVSMLRPYAHNPCLLVAVDHASSEEQRACVTVATRAVVCRQFRGRCINAQ